MSNYILWVFPSCKSLLHSKFSHLLSFPFPSPPLSAAWEHQSMFHLQRHLQKIRKTNHFSLIQIYILLWNKIQQHKKKTMKVLLSLRKSITLKLLQVNLILTLSKKLFWNHIHSFKMITFKRSWTQFHAK